MKPKTDSVSKLAENLWTAWLIFTESPKGRKTVLEEFDKMIALRTDKPELVEWLKKLKQIFLDLEKAEVAR